MQSSKKSLYFLNVERERDEWEGKHDKACNKQIVLFVFSVSACGEEEASCGKWRGFCSDRLQPAGCFQG